MTPGRRARGARPRLITGADVEDRSLTATRSGTVDTVLSQKATVAEPSRIFAVGQYVYSANGTTTNGGSLRLRCSGAASRSPGRPP